MFYVDNPTGVPVMPPVAAELSKTTLYFTEGGNGIPPTYPGPDWFNIVQSELLEILRQANISPDKTATDQIIKSLKKLFISNSGSAGAIAGLTGRENTFPYFTGEDTMELTPLSAFVRSILGKDSANEIIAALGLQDTQDAVQRTGDEMTGKLTLPQTSAFGVNTNNTLGGNSIVLGDTDTGFKQNGDGVLDVYANNQNVFRFQSGAIQSNKPLNVTGRLTPSDYANFDARYQPKGNYTPSGQTYTKAESDARFLQGWRMGAAGAADNGNNDNIFAEAPNGSVVVSVMQKTNWTAVKYRYAQYKINGTWYNAGVI